MLSTRETDNVITKLREQLSASEKEIERLNSEVRRLAVENERLSSIVGERTRQLENQSARFSRLSADFESLRDASSDQASDPIVSFHTDDGSIYSWPLVGVGEVFLVESTEGFRRWELQVNRQAVVQSLTGREVLLAEHARLLALLRRALSPRRSPPPSRS